jgi:hypothetical protein
MLNFGQHSAVLEPGDEFDFTQFEPLGVATFRLLSDARSHEHGHFAIGLQFVAAGIVAISQEKIPAPSIHVLARGTAAADSGEDGAFQLDVQGPNGVSGSFRYQHLNDDVVSTSISHVAFIGSAAVIRGAARVDGVDGFTFVVTAADHSPDSIGVEIRAPDGSAYFHADQRELSSGTIDISAEPSNIRMHGHISIVDGNELHRVDFKVRERVSRAETGALDYERESNVEPARGWPSLRSANRDRFHSTIVTRASFSDASGATPGKTRKYGIDQVDFSGIGTWNGQPGYTFSAIALDAEGSKKKNNRDAFALTIWDSLGNVVVNVNSFVTNGDIKSKKP